MTVGVGVQDTLSNSFGASIAHRFAFVIPRAKAGMIQSVACVHRLSPSCYHVFLLLHFSCSRELPVFLGSGNAEDSQLWRLMTSSMFAIFSSSSVLLVLR